jgi:hypothetical protein
MIKLENASSNTATEWVSFAISKELADEKFVTNGDYITLRTNEEDPRDFPAVRSRLGFGGPSTVFVDALVTLAPGASIDGCTLVDAPTWLNNVGSFVGSNWLSAQTIPQLWFNGELCPTNLTLAHENKARQWWKSGSRCGRFWVDIWMKFQTLSDIVPFEIDITHSYPDDSILDAPLNSLVMRAADPFVINKGETRGMSALTFHSPDEAAELGLTQFPNGYYEMSLIPGTDSVADGQKLPLIRGTILAVPNDRPLGALLASRDAADLARVATLMSYLESPFRAIGTYDPATNPYLCFGVVPWVTAGDGADSQAVYDANNDPVTGEFTGKSSLWWESRRGLKAYTGATGSQDDFGAVKGIELLTWRDPRHLDDMLAQVNDMLRPTHFKESNGSRVLKSQHPGWWTWSQRTHFHPSQSPDRLGKPAWYPQWINHGWTGKDTEHISSNFLHALCAHVESPTLFGLVADEAEVSKAFIYRQASEGTGATRSIGRRLHADVNTYLLTGDAELLDTMETDIAKAWNTSIGKTFAAGKVRVHMTYSDARLLRDPVTGLPRPTWSTWEHGALLTGLAAYHAMCERIGRSPTASATSLMRMVCDTLALHCFYDSDGAGLLKFKQDIYYTGEDPLDVTNYRAHSRYEFIGDEDVEYDKWNNWIIPPMIWVRRSSFAAGLASGVTARIDAILTQLGDPDGTETPATREWFAQVEAPIAP